jgi:hypothetical protein
MALGSEPRRGSLAPAKFAIGRSSAGKRVITLQPVGVTTTSSSMRAAEKLSLAGH